jgi:DNA repair protein RadD
MLTPPLITARDTLLWSLSGGLPVSLAPSPLPFLPWQLGAWGLRDYQEEMLLEALHLMRLGYRRILLVLPTGGGKTRMSAAMLGSASQIALTGQFMVHRKELIDQTSDTFTEAGITHGFVASGRETDVTASVILAGIATLAKRLGQVLPPNLAILDEAHHCTATTWERVLTAYGDSYIIGLTATPERLDGRGLREHFDVMVIGPSVADLIEWGYLSPYSYYAPSIPDMSGVGSLAGDFNKAGVVEVMDRPKLVGDIVEHYLRLAPGQRGIVFGASREHSRHIADAFRGEGVRAAHVDGDSDDRDRQVKAFRAGDLDVMTNVDLFGEGFDVPGVVYCGLGRPTKSLSMYRQQVGRSFRMFAGKVEAVICDHAGNALPSHLGGRGHGLPDDDREWSLDGRAARARATAVESNPVRQCLNCYRVSPSSLPACPGCGTEFPVQNRDLASEEGMLTKLEREELRKAEAAKQRAEERSCRSQGELEQLARARGYEFPRQWAQRHIAGRHQKAARFRR